MSQSKQKICREGCGATIYLSDHTGKWLPYNMDNSPHRCLDKGQGQAQGQNGEVNRPVAYSGQAQGQQQQEPVVMVNERPTNNNTNEIIQAILQKLDEINLLRNRLQQASQLGSKSG